MFSKGFVSALKLWAGADAIDPPLDFPPPEFGGPILTFGSWSEISQMCGDTRVWAGLHFEVCDGHRALLRHKKC